MARMYADDNAVPNDWRTRQPGFTIWIIIVAFRSILEALFYCLFYIPSSFRQSSDWTYRQACLTRVCERVAHIIFELGFTQSLSLEPGELGVRWKIIQPAPDSAYRGDFWSEHIQPEVVGGTWYPELPSKQWQLEEQNLVVLSFHSGSLLWLNGRPDDSGPTATLLNNTLGNNTHSFWLQYRLAGGDNPTPWPGAMQDAVTAYIYLIKELGISPARIVLAGDSTGSTIAMALLRYLTTIDQDSDHDLAGLPPPKACLLFSPSVEYCFEGDPDAVSSNRNIKTDYVESRIMAWGARAIAPPDVVRLDSEYISPALHPFATPTPIFVQAGGAEVLCDSCRGFAERFRNVPGNQIEYFEVPGVPHDVYVVGTILGWPKEQHDVHEAAARFVHEH